MLAGEVDVAEIAPVAVAADRAEALLHHHFGKADDGVERRPDLVADLGEEIRLLRIGGLGGAARGDKLLLDILPVGDVAKHGAVLAGLAKPADGHEQRDEAAARHPADHLAAVIEDARDAVRGEPVDIVERRLAALLGEEIGERLARHVRRLDAEQRLGGAVDAGDASVALDHHDAVGGRVEDRLQFVDALAASPSALGVTGGVCRLGRDRTGTSDSIIAVRADQGIGWSRASTAISAPSRRSASSRPLSRAKRVASCISGKIASTPPATRKASRSS